MNPKRFEQTESIVDPETGTIGLVIWLGTKEEDKAKERIKAVEDKYNTGEKAMKGKRK